MPPDNQSHQNYQYFHVFHPHFDWFSALLVTAAVRVNNLKRYDKYHAAAVDSAPVAPTGQGRALPEM